MPPIPREIVEQTVALYGLAWTTQNPELLSQIFTNDIVYMERVFDRKATFVGLEAVKEYWDRQIVHKQSNITFRHLTSRMIRDIDQPVAIVHWLAEFDNKREQRGPDKTHKRVHFAQMARLTFVAVTTAAVDNNNNHNNNNPQCFKVCELEEYAQPMTGPGVQWPGLERPESDYGPLLRMESVPDRSRQTIVQFQCDYCHQGFVSRSQLFKHLKTTIPSSSGTQCQSIEPTVWVWISMSVGYTTNMNISDRIKALLLEWIQSSKRAPHCSDDKDDNTVARSIDWNSITWAVPPAWSTSAVVNVASIKMEETTWQRISSSNNNGDGSKDNNPSSQSTLPPPPPLVSPDQSLRIHTMVPVDRPCVSERREFEKYEAFVPWRFLKPSSSSLTSSSHADEDRGGVIITQRDKNDAVNGHEMTISSTTTSSVAVHSKGWRRQDYHQAVHRKPLEETPAGEFCTTEMTRRLRTCTRILKDGGKDKVGDFFDVPGQLKIRLRCSTLDNPYQAYCRISVSMRQPHSGCVEAIVGLVMKFAKMSTMNEQDLRDEAVVMTDRLQSKQRETMRSAVPSDFCILLEPGLNRYEVKAGVQLSGGYTNEMTPDSSFWAARQSMDEMEHSIMLEITTKLPELKKWINDTVVEHDREQQG
jgi:SnoaL-like domain